MKLTYSKKIFILAALIFVTVLILDVISLELLSNKIKGINDKVKQLTISAQERERNLRLKDSIANSQAERVKLEGYFVGEGDSKTADFISNIEILAKNAGLSSTIKSVDYEPITDLGSSDTIQFIRFRLNVSGKWDSIFGFLQTIESLPKVNVLNALTLETSGKGWSADLDFSVVKLKN